MSNEGNRWWLELDLMETERYKFKNNIERLKKESVLLAEKYFDVNMTDRSEKVINCAQYVRFKIVGDGSDVKRKFDGVYFCKDKFCPVCMARKSMLMVRQLTNYTEVLKEKGYGFLHLTLTLKNMDDPKMMLDKLWQSWRDLRRRKVFEVFEGAYVSMEVTYTKEKGYHYHLHTLLATKMKLPMEKEKFHALEEKISDEWLEITKDSYIVKLQGAKNIYQLCKYVTKIKCVEEMDNQEFKEFVKIMMGRRMVSKVGVFRGLDDEVENMMEVDNEELEEEEEIILYEGWRWNRESKSYKIEFFDIMGNKITQEEADRIIDEWRKKNVSS